MKSTTKREKRSAPRKFRYAETVTAAVLLITAIMCFSGCDKTVVATQGEAYSDAAKSVSFDESQEITIGYSTEDSLNPFFITTDINSDIVSLLYEPLFYTDDSFCAVNCLAASCSQQGNRLTVVLNTAAAFSDGVQLSSADVVYSFNMAKASDNYKDELANIISAAASGTDTVIFTLSGGIKNGADALTFPIVKTSTAQSEDASPIGTGLYRRAADNSPLTYNPYCLKPEPNIKTVKLCEIESSSTLIHTLELGTIDAYFDDFSAGSYSRANAASAKTNLPNLVFLGMNSSSYGLSSAAFRQAVYYSINRQSIVKNSFKNYAVESFMPYHPEWHIFASSGYDKTNLTLDYSKAKTLLTDAGFSGSVNLKLIVYSGNNFKVAAAREIKENLASIGINITVSELTWESYRLALANGEYDLYIGEVKLPRDMNLSSLFGDSSVVYGVSAKDTTAAAYSEYAEGNISLNAFTDSFMQNMPFAPICFRMGALVYSNDISPAADCDIGNAYKNIYEWTVAKSE